MYILEGVWNNLSIYLFWFQDFCRLYGIRPDADRHEMASSAAVKRQRLLSETEAPTTTDSNACSVEDVLRLLQLLYAISRDGNIENNITGKNVQYY